jgi:HEPN domain-containing protein
MDEKYILEWFLYGDRDLAVAEHSLSLHPQPYEIICYLCQQSAEKYLKGYLVYNNINDLPKIHNLDALCDMCEAYDESFDDIQKPCNALTDYSVQPRYPHEMLVEEHHMKKALEYARQIKEFAPLVTARQELEQAVKKESMPSSEQ